MATRAAGRALDAEAGRGPAEAPADPLREIASLEARVTAAPGDLAAWTRLGVMLSTLGMHEPAARAFAVVAAARPESPAAHFNLGRALAAAGRPDAAAGSFERVCDLSPAAPAGYLAWAEDLASRGRTAEARAVLARALARGCSEASVQFAHAAFTHQEGLHAAAAEAYGRLVALHPGRAAEAHYGRAACFAALGDLVRAIHEYDEALALAPDMVEALVNRALLRLGGGEPARAWPDIARALALAPGVGAVRKAAGRCALALGRHGDALEYLQAALQADAADPESWEALGDVHGARRSLLAAAESYRLAESRLPDGATAPAARGRVLHKRIDALFAAGRFADARARAEELAAFAPAHPYLPGLRLFASAWSAHWQSLDDLRAAVLARATGPDPVCEPFPLVAVSDDPAVQQAATRAYVARHFGRAPEPSPRIRPAGRIRIAYLSPDFRDHPVGHLIAGTLERHDRRRFEVFALSSHPFDESSGISVRIRLGVDHFEDISERSDLEVVRWAREQGIDVLVDLAAHTNGGRPGILASRAAPIQVNYLGYPGTYGANFVDYLIADANVVPTSQDWAYDECVVRLPGSMVPPGDVRRDPPSPLSRTDLGLPRDALLLGGFHNTYKILPEVFAAWMGLLRGAPRSRLWLSRHEPSAARALQEAARSAGVDPARLHFADRVASHAEHLGRLAQVDLMLDTFPYNAHSSAADALWAGVPIVTQRGRSFASRVCAGLLATAGFDELITESLADYQRVAARLLEQPSELAALQARLRREIRGSVLFQADTYTRYLEAAFEEMVIRARRGEAPAPFAIPA